MKGAARTHATRRLQRRARRDACGGSCRRSGSRGRAARSARSRSSCNGDAARRSAAPAEMTRVQIAVAPQCSTRIARSAARLEPRDLLDPDRAQRSADRASRSPRRCDRFRGKRCRRAREGGAAAIVGEGRCRERNETCARAASPGASAAASTRAMPSACMDAISCAAPPRARRTASARLEIERGSGASAAVARAARRRALTRARTGSG